jgi:hypothetical protein
MFTNWDARDVGGLGEVIRSHECGRATDAMGGRGVFGPAGREDGLFAQEGGPEALSEETEVQEQLQQVECSGDGAPLGLEHAEAPPTPPSKRRATRYGTIASVSALVALVAVGVMAVPGHHTRSSVSAQGKHHTARPRSGLGSPGAASTGSTAPRGSLTTAAGAGGPSSDKATGAGLRAGNAPGGHVSLVRPSTFTGTPTSPAASPTASGSSPSVGGGATGSPSPSGTANPVAPVTPAAAPAIGVADTVVNTLGQVVSASTE